MMTVGDALCVQAISTAAIVFAAWTSGVGPLVTIINLVAGTAILWLVWAITQVGI